MVNQIFLKKIIVQWVKTFVNHKHVHCMFQESGAAARMYQRVEGELELVQPACFLCACAALSPILHDRPSAAQGVHSGGQGQGQ